MLFLLCRLYRSNAMCLLFTSFKSSSEQTSPSCHCTNKHRHHTVYATLLVAYSYMVHGWCWNTKLVRICQAGEVYIMNAGLCFLQPCFPNSVKKCCHVPKLICHVEYTCNLSYASHTCIYQHNKYMLTPFSSWHVRDTKLVRYYTFSIPASLNKTRGPMVL